MDDQSFEINLIENLTSEHNEEIELEAECEFELESEDFNLDEIVNSAVNWVSSPIALNLESTNLISPSIELSPSLELKSFPKHLKYVYLDGQETLPVIIASHLTTRQEESLMCVLRKHRGAIDWMMTDIKRLNLAIV